MATKKPVAKKRPAKKDLAGSVSAAINTGLDKSGLMMRRQR